MFSYVLVGAAVFAGQTSATSPAASEPTYGIVYHVEDPPPVPAGPPPSGHPVGDNPDAAPAEEEPAADANFGKAAAPEIPAPETVILFKPEPPQAAEEAAAAAAAAPDRWLLMKELQGTCVGACLDDHRMQLSGWLAGSYTASTTDITNQPVVWNDRANEFLFQQGWVRFERSLATSGTTEPTFGFRSDWLIGSDYRFTLPRGLWNSQLLNADGNQNIYGVDPIQFYVNCYVPNLFQGTEFRLGRHYCPFGMESLEAVSTPLMSRSYAFNWCPPFTHVGLMALTTINPQWSTNLMIVNGNDVWLDPAEEWRFAGKLSWISVNKRDSISFGTSIGRGKFNAGEPFAPATIGLSYEPAGRNNINVFDLVYTRLINPVLTYNLEVIYGYQYAVPANVVGGIIAEGVTTGTAHWGSVVNYLTYTFGPRLTGITRLEFFDDFEGQRTGFEGLYTAITVGLQYRPRKSIIVRPEIRYDHNGYSTPFEGKHDILTAGSDIIFRW